MTLAGLLLPTREAAISGDWNARRMIDLARQAEHLGFDSVWAGDSLTARPRLEPLSLLAGVAAATESITVGTAALIAPLRHPLLAAHAIATVDRLSAGRLVLGLGAGFPLPATEAEFAAAGVPFGERVGRLTEGVRLWRHLWSAEPASAFDGKYWRLADIGDVPKPARPGGPPLWLAGAGPAALRRVGRVFDGWLPYPPAAAEFRQGRDAIAAAAAEAHRDPATITHSMYVTVLPHDDHERAQELLAAYAEVYYGAPIELVAKVQAFVAGPLESIEARLRSYADAGAEHFVLRIGSLDHTGYLEPVAELVRRVHLWN